MALPIVAMLIADKMLTAPHDRSSEVVRLDVEEAGFPWMGGRRTAYTHAAEPAVWIEDILDGRV